MTNVITNASAFSKLHSIDLDLLSDITGGKGKVGHPAHPGGPKAGPPTNAQKCIARGALGAAAGAVGGAATGPGAALGALGGFIAGCGSVFVP